MNRWGRDVRWWAAVTIPAVTAIAAASVSWQRWITPFVDGSREMSVPARIASGERLYRDIAYAYGPVGSWAGAALMKCFGAGWLVLEALCAGVTAILLISMYCLVRITGSARAALVAVTATAAICIGAPLGGAFIFPYSIDFLIALAFGFATLALASGKGPGALVLAAVCLAITIGARVEVGLPIAALLLLVGLRWRRRPTDARPARITVLVAVGGTAAGAFLWTIALVGIPARDLSPEGPGLLFSPPAEWRRVYRFVAGLDDPAAGVARVATGLFLLVFVIASAWIFRRAPRFWIALVVTVVGLQLTSLGRSVDARWPSMLSPVPVASIILAGVFLTRPWSTQTEARFLLFSFSALVASRVLLRLTYGQELTPFSIMALPAVLATAAVALIDLVPRALGERAGGFRRNLGWMFAGVAAAGFLRMASMNAPSRSKIVQTPAGSLRLPPLEAGPTGMAFDYLARRARPGDRLVGFPEAGIFNLALGLRNPLREEQLLPGHLNASDEERVVDRLIKTRPRFVLLIGQPSRAFGRVAFGEDYARRIWAVIRREYEASAIFGTNDPSARIGESPFFIEVFEPRGPKRLSFENEN